MARSPKRLKRFAWDACAWIAGIRREVVIVGGRPENRGALCDAIRSEAEKGGAEIFSSAFAIVEVCKHPDDLANPGFADQQVRDYFENDYIVIVPVDRRVGELARDLMRVGHAGLKPPDATHLATALVANADELHTFDDKLLNLDGKLNKLDGTKLRICKPAMGGEPLPLLNALENDDEEVDQEEENEERPVLAALMDAPEENVHSQVVTDNVQETGNEERPEKPT